MVSLYDSAAITARISELSERAVGEIHVFTDAVPQAWLVPLARFRNRTLSPPRCVFQNDTDWSPPRWSLGTAHVNDRAACCLACLRTRGCVVGTLYAHTCYLKAEADTVGGSYQKPGVTSCRIEASMANRSLG